VSESNNLTFDEGVERINQALKEARLEVGNEIITSRDEKVMKVQELLDIKNMPQGFKKWQLPVMLRCESQMYITVASPNAKVSQHLHEGPSIRFIVKGSIRYNGTELTAGDWIYIPADVQYALEAGSDGGTTCGCYCCSCVPRP
jgi:hypothetical protein